MATVQTWLTRRPRDLFHDHMLFVPVITQHALNFSNEIRREIEVGAVLFITLRPMSRVIWVDFNRRAHIQVTPKHCQSA